MIAAAAVSTDAPASAVRSAQSEIMPPPTGFDMWPILRVLCIAVAVVAAALLLVSAVRTVVFRGTWTESLNKGPAKPLIGSTVVLLASTAAVTALDWASG